MFYENITYSELFHSIQGEGSLSGVPSVFFRTSGCNLRCNWCDTPYTSFIPERKIIRVDECVQKILDYDCSHVVITGGEPFLQQSALQQLCGEIKKAELHITIETNGTIYCYTEADLISLSPKLSDSAPTEEQVSKRWIKKHEKDRINLSAINLFYRNHDCQFKFVVYNDEHIDEVKAFKTLVNFKDSEVYLMPEGKTNKDLQCSHEWVAEQCIANKWRYSDRLHVRLWNDKRGV